jgi:hypothetical protein
VVAPSSLVTLVVGPSLIFFLVLSLLPPIDVAMLFLVLAPFGAVLLVSMTFVEFPLL